MYRLVAHGIGGRTVQELMDTMTVDEFCEWRTLLSFQPLPIDRLEWQSSMLRYTLSQVNSKKKLDPMKFVAKWQPKGLATAEEIQAKLEYTAMAMGAEWESPNGN